uniref:Thioredoxin domain-containing protein n=1 Tax=Meloidogyne incognita TaxID=6306 RepID=A0A914LFM4_MELIC
MLDELRKLPSELTDGRKLRVGTLDCDAYRDICTGERINSYPRTILYMGDDSQQQKQQQQHSLIGFHTVDQLLEFISEALNPTVQVLNPDNFDDIVYGGGQSFFVDFFAPWCGPCQKLAPEFRQLARQWASSHNEDPNQLVFASVDCEQYSNLCNRENVNSFPALRFYRKLQGGKIDVNNYPSNWWRNVQTMSHWLTEIMPSLVQKIAGDFANTVLDSSEPWLIDFYVRLGKIDCERFNWICENAQINYFPQILLYFGTKNYKRQETRGMEISTDGTTNAEIIAQTIREYLEKYRYGGEGGGYERVENERDEL